MMMLTLTSMPMPMLTDWPGPRWSRHRVRG
jgi:hypothetical protein